MVDPFAKTPNAFDLRLLPQGIQRVPVRIRVSAAPSSRETALPAAPGALPPAPGVARNRAIVTLSSEEIAKLQSAIRAHGRKDGDVAGAQRVALPWLAGIASFVTSGWRLLVGTLS